MADLFTIKTLLKSSEQGGCEFGHSYTLSQSVQMQLTEASSKVMIWTF
jgi:hypothetical protein